MGFDASKLVVGKKYRRRDGGMARFLGTINNPSYPLAFAFEGGTEFVNTVTSAGIYCEPSSRLDTISDEPIKELVSVEIRSRFVVVYGNDLVSGNYSHMEDAIAAARKGSAIGIAELPATLLVTPK